VVPRGATVTWVNRDPFPHTATARGAFDSGSIAPDGTWSWKAARAGRYEYVCTLHPNMKGVLVVE
jgi:plastocyanin